LREEHGLTVFENMALRKILRLKWEEIMGGRRKFDKEELHDSYSGGFE
jgi:hypothetical protein